MTPGQHVRYRPRGFRRWYYAWYVERDERGWHVLERIGGDRFTVAAGKYEVEPA